MQILYLLQLISPSVGGGEALFYNFATSMLRKGHGVDIICYDLKVPDNTTKIRPGSDISDLITEGARIHTISPAIEDRGGVILTYGQQMGYIINALRKGRQILKRTHIDIIHANTYTPIIPAFVLGKMSRIPVVSTVHHVALGHWETWSSQTSVHASISFVGPIYEKLILKTPVQRVHVVSHTTEEDLKSINPKAKITTIYNGIDLTNYQSLETKCEYNRFILYIGRIVITKNLGVVIHAFKQVIKAFPDAKLVIVGEGPMHYEWEQLVRINTLDRNVIFTGYVSPDRKQQLLSSCTGLVLPSKLEGFGRVIIEAFAMHKPVLVSNLRSLTEIVNEGIDGFLIPPDDVQKWADRIIYLFSNEECCRLLGKNGRNKVEERFNVGLISNKIEELYRDVILDMK